MLTFIINVKRCYGFVFSVAIWFHYCWPKISLPWLAKWSCSWNDAPNVSTVRNRSVSLQYIEACIQTDQSKTQIQNIIAFDWWIRKVARFDQCFGIHFNLNRFSLFFARDWYLRYICILFPTFFRHCVAIWPKEFSEERMRGRERKKNVVQNKSSAYTIFPLYHIFIN